jgi:HEAT repeat protein/beta-lactamase regulating signal transducer with metallopeptidase domain
MSVLSIPAAIDAVAKASLILAVTALAAASLRRASASARHLVWMLGLVSALAVPALGIVTPKWELPLVKITEVTETQAQHHYRSTEEQRHLGPAASRNTAVSGVLLPDVAPIALPSSSSSSRTPFSPSPLKIVMTIWALGAAIVLGRMLLGLIAVQWMSRRTAVVTEAPWLDEARSLAASLDLRGVRYLRNNAQSMPMAWGVFRSSVLMPADADGWPIERLRIVLLHELAHVKRHDCFTHLVAQLACAAYWFNPLVWMAARRVRTERERACDDLVLASGTRGSDYADQLLDIARVMRAGRFPAVLAGATLAMAHRSQLEGRLMAILDPKVQRRGLTRVGVLAAVGLFAILIVPVAAVQPWTLTSEPAALKGSMDPIPPQQQVDRPIESVPGQAASDNRANAAQQNVIQNDVQGRIQGAVQGGIAGGVSGGIAHGIAEGVRGGVQGGVEGSIKTHVGAGIGAGVGTGVGIGVDLATGVTQTIVNGMANGIANGVVRNLPELAQAAGPRQRQADPRAVNALVDALKDTDKDVRETAMQALVELRDPHIFEPLVMALHDSSADIRQKAAFGLGQLRDARAIAPLATAVKDQDAGVREQAVFALGQLRAAEAIDAITPALHDSSDSVREQAAFALGQIRDPRAVEPLISALKDPKPDIRQQAAFALGQIRSPKAVDALVIALKDGQTDVREQAAFALGQIRDPRAIEGLTAALKDASASVRQQAAFALGQIR